jgi:hypothetical protein
MRADTLAGKGGDTVSDFSTVKLADFSPALKSCWNSSSP